jgi:YfiH family protein
MSGPPVVQSALLAQAAGVRHAFFTRRGGVSTGVYESLNVGVGSNDQPDAVLENRRRAAAVFEAPPESLLTCYQIHSATVVTTDAAWSVRPEADGVATKTPGLVCGALAADCAPVLLADAEAGVVAAAHAGWRGALEGVVGAAVAAMTGLGARPERIVAAVGPCIGPKSYEVGLEFLAAFEARDADYARFFSPGVHADKRMFDLPGFVLSRLAAAGVERCEWIGADTFAEPAAFFSNRRAFRRGETDYGRLLSAIMLEG